ncbi:transcriptional regulator [Bifidobacterium sp. DSM 109958]|uniref:Transcriptional regulator n=1 Tax=Bifidobacterium moraviense TaxID=2675323 RepID=A0A7Y0F014_9BIFI|nr:LCP family protein [Bifidobacterium sp. DSM 109958]NMM99535.1 transcriptional regulator [Bifidobacterium sp. DSM 109958]
MTQPSQPGDQQGNPPSFVPSGAPRRQSAARPQPARASVPPSFSPAPAASPAPRAVRQERRVGGSTGRVPAHALPSEGTAHAVSVGPSASMSRQPAAGAAVASPSRRGGPRRRRPLRIALAVLLVLALALGLSVLSAWRWVDGQLNRQDMLTGKANTPAQTWLILGSDERDANDGTGIVDPTTTGFRTDTILVLTRPKSGHASLISIPRDSLVKVNGKDMKINAAAQAGGYPALVGTVESITGMNVDHVALIHFGGLQKVVDALGGVDLCYDRTVNDEKSGLNWQAGCHTADGATALAFSRMRYSDPKGDFGRAERQRQVIGAITKKAASAQTLTDLAKVRSLVETGLGALTLDENAGTWSLVQMALAFRDASGSDGVNGSVYWTNADYRVSGVGSSVLLDSTRNTELFTQLANGTHAPGTVGGM